jgi:hypothetical protein
MHRRLLKTCALRCAALCGCMQPHASAPAACQWERECGAACNGACLGHARRPACAQDFAHQLAAAEEEQRSKMLHAPVPN